MVAYSLMAHVCDGLFLGPRSWVLIITPFSSYCDEFGSSLDPNKSYMGIAGLLGTVEQWKGFEEGWRSAIDTERIPWPFHMKDFVHAKRDFENERWRDLNERMRVIRILLNVIDSANVFPVAAAVVLKDYHGLSLAQKRRLKGPYFAAFQEVTYNLAFGAAIAADDRASVTMFYAKLKKCTGPAEKWWDAIKEYNPHVDAHMTSYTPAEPKDVSPLQAADIFAYSIGRTAERDPSKCAEATLAMSLFDHMIWNKSPGNKCFELLDRKKLLESLGEDEDV